MAQPVCVLCGERIAAADGTSCPSCGAPVHANCTQASTKGAGACAACGAPGGRPGPLRATLPHVRFLGGFLAAYGIALAIFCQGQLYEDVVPLPWIGYAAIAVGALMLLVPSLWRGHVARLLEKERGVWVRHGHRAASGSPLPGATFEGTYETILYAKLDRPFPLRGEGRLTIGPHGLEATGQEVAMLSPLASILVATAVAGIALLSVALAMTVGAGWLALLLGIPLVCAPFVRRRQRDIVTVPIPWANVHGFAEQGPLVRILVKGMRPAGEIRFVPAAGALPLLAALRARG